VGIELVHNNPKNLYYLIQKARRRALTLTLSDSLVDLELNFCMSHSYYGDGGGGAGGRGGGGGGRGEGGGRGHGGRGGGRGGSGGDGGGRGGYREKRDDAEDDEDDRMQDEEGSFLMPDRDFYRKKITTFQTIHSYFENRLYDISRRERRMYQPHFSALGSRRTPYGAATFSDVADGVCSRFIRRGFTKPTKTHFNCAQWSSDASLLVLGTEYGDMVTWEGETLKVKKINPIQAHKVKKNQHVNHAITALARNNFGKLLVSGDSSGLFQICDETFREITAVDEAHSGAIQGLSFSPYDSKLVSGGDDSQLHVWTIGRKTPDVTLSGHQSDVKAVEWHPHRALIASGSRDSAVRLWDPKAGSCVSILTGHKKQVNCLGWNQNGNWLATGAKDNLLKIYDIRTMREIEVCRGHNSDVTSLAWHPLHETLIVSGAYNGSLIYWVAGHTQEPHTSIALAHRQFIDVLAWHPEGHILASSSNDCVLKFWCREAPGSKLDIQDSKEFIGSDFAYGPIPKGASSNIKASNLPVGTLSTVDVRANPGASAPLNISNFTAEQNLKHMMAQLQARKAQQGALPIAPRPVSNLPLPPGLGSALPPPPGRAGMPLPPPPMGVPNLAARLMPPPAVARVDSRAADPRKRSRE